MFDRLGHMSTLVFFISQIWLKEGVSSLGTSGG